jgi:hypothetical protein
MYTLRPRECYNLNSPAGHIVAGGLDRCENC